MWMPRPPRESQVIDFLMDADQQPLNFASEADLANLGGGTRFCRQICLGTGERTLQLAHEVLTKWLMLPEDNVDLYWPERATRPGTSLAIGMQLYGGYWLNPCRVVEFTETPAQESTDVISRITWKTIRGHCLAGTETFVIRMNANGEVRYEISSIAAPMQWLRPLRSLVDSARQHFQLKTCHQFARILNRYDSIRHERKSKLAAQHAHLI